MRPAGARPRLGFLGVGWIGEHRLKAIAESGLAEVAAVADPVPEALARAQASASGARVFRGLDELLRSSVDGVVVATPSALHAEQAIAALDAGVAVFCQKPLGRTAAECRAVVEAARRADRLLGVDLSYRHVRAARAVREELRQGHIGTVYAAQLVFHNAYGPDKPWFYNPELSGGGCVMDLGIHLVDLALWCLGFPAVTGAAARLYAGGEPLGARPDRVEDYAVGQLHLEGGATAALACSWRLPAGRDAVIEASFYGTGGGLSLRNVGGSFYDFRAESYRGTSRSVLAEGPDEWGGGAALAWVRALASGAGFDPEAERLVEVARVLDDLYGRGPGGSAP